MLKNSRLFCTSSLLGNFDPDSKNIICLLCKMDLTVMTLISYTDILSLNLKYINIHLHSWRKSLHFKGEIPVHVRENYAIFRCGFSYLGIFCTFILFQKFDHKDVCLINANILNCYFTKLTLLIWYCIAINLHCVYTHLTYVCRTWWHFISQQ